MNYLENINNTVYLPVRSNVYLLKASNVSIDISRRKQRDPEEKKKNKVEKEK